jgi:hypothetical protein
MSNVGKSRDREDLRKTMQHAAALKIEIAAYAQKPEDASARLRHILTSSRGAGPTGITSSQYAVHFFRRAIPVDIETKLEEFERESERLQKLEQQVSEFS